MCSKYIVYKISREKNIPREHTKKEYIYERNNVEREHIRAITIWMIELNVIMMAKGNLKGS